MKGIMAENGNSTSIGFKKKMGFLKTRKAVTLNTEPEPVGIDLHKTAFIRVWQPTCVLNPPSGMVIFQNSVL
jgi:hypothetical protein